MNLSSSASIGEKSSDLTLSIIFNNEEQLKSYEYTTFLTFVHTSTKYFPILFSDFIPLPTISQTSFLSIYYPRFQKGNTQITKTL